MGRTYETLLDKLVVGGESREFFRFLLHGIITNTVDRRVDVHGYM